MDFVADVPNPVLNLYYVLTKSISGFFLLSENHCVS